MSKRQNTFRVDSTAVQGEGSFVVMRRMSYGLIREANLSTAEDRDPKTAAIQNDAFNRKLLGEAVVAWNWVDDKDNPLPLPGDGFNIDDLLQNEIEFLIKQATGAMIETQAQDSKN